MWDFLFYSCMSSHPGMWGELFWEISEMQEFFFFFFLKIEIFSEWFFCFSSLKGSLLKHKKNRNFLILGLESLIFELLFENYKTFFFFLLFKLELANGQVAVESTIVQKGHLFFFLKGTKNFPSPNSIPFLSVLHQYKALHNFTERGIIQSQNAYKV